MLKRLQQELKECSDNEPVRKMVLIKKIQKLQKIQKLNQNITKKNNVIVSIKPFSIKEKEYKNNALEKLLEMNDNDNDNDNDNNDNDNNNKDDNNNNNNESVNDYNNNNINELNNELNINNEEYFSPPKEVNDTKFTKHVEKDFINNKLKDRLFSESAYKGTRLKQCNKPFSEEKTLFNTV